jgi:hypothetical protein
MEPPSTSLDSNQPAGQASTRRAPDERRCECAFDARKRVRTGGLGWTRAVIRDGDAWYSEAQTGALELRTCQNILSSASMKLRLERK